MRAALSLLVLLLPVSAHAQTLHDLAWLRGCWRFEREGEVVTEAWTAPPAPAMLGFGYTTRGAEVRVWEQTRIEARDDGLAYVAMPGGAAPVRFPMVEASANRVVFANLAHDFPQRIEYVRDGNSLTAAVSGAGAEAEIYPYRRIRCPASLRP